MKQLFTFCQVAHFFIPNFLPQQDAKLSTLTPSQELAMTLQTIYVWCEMGQTALLNSFEEEESNSKDNKRTKTKSWSVLLWKRTRFCSQV